MNDKLIYYSKGQIFEEFAYTTDWRNVVAVADRAADQGQMIAGKPLIRPEDIGSCIYDYIIVFSNKYYEEIRKELTYGYEVDPEIILPYQAIVENERDREIGDHDEVLLTALKEIIAEEDMTTILDADKILQKNHIINCGILGNDHLQIYTISDGNDNHIRIPYLGFVHDKTNVSNLIFDLIFLRYCTDVNKFQKVLMEYMPYGKMIFFISPYFQGDQFCGCLFREFSDLKRIYTKNGIVWIWTGEPSMTRGSRNLRCSMYVVCHKKYFIYRNKDYLQINVGKYRDDRNVSDDTLDNIAFLNDKINECTAMYWIWKNTRSDYIGLCHYRRYFCLKWKKDIGAIISKEDIIRYLDQSDIILGKIFDTGCSVREHLNKYLNASAFDEAYEIVLRNMKKKQPDYVDAFAYTMNGRYYYINNMFVTRFEIFGEYCSWLFSFLIDSAKEFCADKYDEYSHRAIGFFAEVMLTVWLSAQRWRVLTLPVMVTDSVKNSLENGMCSLE